MSTFEDLVAEGEAVPNATIVEVDGAADLPLPSDHFDLVVSRHPVEIRWGEIGRVLRPNGTYLSQQVRARCAS